MNVAVAADRRFRRGQARSARRRRAWGVSWFALARRAALLLAVAYGCYRAGALALGAEALRISHLVVRGNDRLSTGEVLALVGTLRGENILLVNLDEWRRRLLTSAWVEHAALRRILPGTVEILVVERQPIGVARLGSALYLVDGRGVMIDEYGPQYAELDLPIIDGLASDPQKGGPATDEVHARLAARVLESVRPSKDLTRRLSQIDVTDAHDAVVILDGDPALIHLGTEKFLERLQSYQELAPALRTRVPVIDYVDLRFDERVYVRPATGHDPAAPAAGSAAAPSRRF